MVYGYCVIISLGISLNHKVQCRADYDLLSTILKIEVTCQQWNSVLWTAFADVEMAGTDQCTISVQKLSCQVKYVYFRCFFQKLSAQMKK